MAGIGFRLRALADRGDLGGAVAAYGYSLFLVAGPWIFTVLALLGVTFALRPTTSWEDVQTFRSIIIYNFCITLILTGPIVLMGTRYLADQVYNRDLKYVPFALFISTAIIAVMTVTVGAGFYIGAVTLEPDIELQAIFNFGLVCAIWVITPFLSMVKDFKGVSLSFAAGCFSVVLLIVLSARYLDDFLLLLIFNAALTLVLASVLYRVVREYAGPVIVDPNWKSFLVSRWELALFGLFYYLGIWVDKIVMWRAGEPGQVTIGGVLSTQPIYDATMFVAQLMAIPAFVVFFVHIETRFFELCQSFYKSFENNATLRAARVATESIGRFVLSQTAALVAAMALLAGLLMLTIPLIHDHIGIRTIQIGILRVGLIGTAFHTTFLLCLVFFLYFDLRRIALFLSALFFVLNGGLTWLLLPLGFQYYGVGYMMAGALSVAVAAGFLVKELPWLAYHAFVTNNASVKVS